MTTAEARDVPFRFTRAYAYAYEGVNVVRYPVGDAKVSAGCARAATADEAGRAIHVSKDAPKAPPAAPARAELEANLPTQAELEAAKRKAEADAKASAIEAAARAKTNAKTKPGA